MDTVVRAFTEAELALADITSSIARFQSASDQLAAAGIASDRVAAQVAALTSTIGEAASSLRAVDPDRLWAHLEAVERRRAADQAPTHGPPEHWRSPPSAPLRLSGSRR